MRKIVGILVALLMWGGASLSTGQVVRSKRVFEKVTMTADRTLTYRTDDAKVAQVTLTVEDGSPDGTVTVYTRPSTSGGQTQVAQYVALSATKTVVGDAQNVLEVVLSGHSTGSIGVEVVTWW